jgi:thymidylate kinase
VRPRTRGSFVAIEGLDFSGKRTVSAFVEEELLRGQLAVRRNSVKTVPLRNVSKRIDGRRAVPHVRPDLLYLLAVLYDAVRIRRSLRRGISVVQDRYVGSYMWHQAVVRGSRGGLLPLYRLLHRILAPDLTIYCHCAPETLWRRYDAELRSAPKALTQNDELVFSEVSHARIEPLRSGFERVLEETPNVVSIANDSSLDDLRAAVHEVVSQRRGCVAAMKA